MDPVSQAVFGTAPRRWRPPATRQARLRVRRPAAAARHRRRLPLGGRPLLAVKMHRHCTHSLRFVPIGGAIASLPFVLKRDNGVAPGRSSPAARSATRRTRISRRQALSARFARNFARFS